MGRLRAGRWVHARFGRPLDQIGDLLMAPVVVFLLVAAVIAGSLSWPVVAGALFLLAVLAYGWQAYALAKGANVDR